MQKRNIVCLCITVLCSLLFATDPWPDPMLLPESMTLLANVSIDATPASAGDILAAYVQENGVTQLRGKGEIVVIEGVSGCLLQIYTAADDEDIRFMVWDQSSESVCHSEQILLSQINGSIGSYPDNMYPISAYSGSMTADPWPEPEEMNSAMAIMTQVYINDVPTGANDILAAFVRVDGQNELRGKAQVNEQQGSTCMIEVFSESNTETIYYRVWDFESQMMYEDEGLYHSEINGQAGSYPDDLILINPGGAHIVPRPTFSIVPGIYDSELSLSLFCPLMDVSICYTLDSTEPGPDDTVFSDQLPISISVPDSLQIKARAFKSGWEASGILQGEYVVKETVAEPYSNPPGGEYEEPVWVRLFCVTPDATIYYSLDGSDPDTHSIQYFGGFDIAQDTVLKARAYHVDCYPSPVMESTYLIASANPPQGGTPSATGIRKVYPNPFNESLSIAVSIKDARQDYHFMVYNLKGQCVHRESGSGSGDFVLNWDAGNKDKPKLPAGIYFLRFKTPESCSTKRVIMY